MNGTKIYYVYFILSQVIWGVLPAFWLLLRQLPPLYTLSSRIIWASVFCFFLISPKTSPAGAERCCQGALAVALYCRCLHLYYS